MSELDDAREAALARVGRGLLEAITRALQTFASGKERKALREGFTALIEGVRPQRSFLARVDAQHRVIEVLVSEGLSDEQVEALRAGTSSPGVSPSLIRAALRTGRAQVIEDARLGSRRGTITGSLACGAYSVVCATVNDPHSRAPVAVLYLQTSSITQPLTRALVPYIEAYTVALGTAWQVWGRTQHALSKARGERAARAMEIVGDSPATGALRERVHRILIPSMAAERPDPILILGPTGSGKEVLARYLHAWSQRSRGRFVALNCAEFRGDVLESKLFGHVKGAFTGADQGSEGLFMAADHGVLFLDELGDMPMQGQSLLLRALESRSVRAMGARDERPVNVQILCATNKDLEAAVRAGEFREDLYHRIANVTVELLPLRERPEDIPPLLSHYLRHHERRRGKRTLGLSPPVLDLLLRYPWPGNVRELSAVCSVLVMHADPTRRIDKDVLAEAAPKVYAAARRSRRQAPAVVSVDALSGTLAQVRATCERAYIVKVGNESGWERAATARRLGVSRSVFYRLLERYELLKEDNADEQ